MSIANVHVWQSLMVQRIEETTETRDLALMVGKLAGFIFAGGVALSVGFYALPLVPLAAGFVAMLAVCGMSGGYAAPEGAELFLLLGWYGMIELGKLIYTVEVALFICYANVVILALCLMILAAAASLYFYQQYALCNLEDVQTHLNAHLQNQAHQIPASVHSKIAAVEQNRFGSFLFNHAFTTIGLPIL